MKRTFQLNPIPENAWEIILPGGESIYESIYLCPREFNPLWDLDQSKKYLIEFSTTYIPKAYECKVIGYDGSYYHDIIDYIEIINLKHNPKTWRVSTSYEQDLFILDTLKAKHFWVGIWEVLK